VAGVVADEHRGAEQDSGASAGTVPGMGQALGLRLYRGHRPYRLATRTPVLYSRNQPRTNIVPSKENR
jgi:hypothetical protein